MMGPKKQDFWPKINILKGNHGILRIGGALVSQRRAFLEAREDILGQKFILKLFQYL